MKIPKMGDSISDTVHLTSTSNATASVDPIELNKTDLLRLIFIPTLVNNSREPKKCVSGKLIYEKKSRNLDKFPSECNSEKPVKRGTVTINNWFEFSFNTSETYELFKGLKKLYELYRDIGKVQYGSYIYTRIDDSFQEILSIIQNNPSAAQMIGKEENFNIVKSLFKVAQFARQNFSLFVMN